MNPYYDAMNRCAPPEGLRERMEENVLTARPGHRKVFKPKRKKTAALLLAAVLLLGTGAATVWDPLFVRRFGPQAALSALGGAVFQEVNVTSMCDDVSLTVTQALCSDRTFYLLLEYKLPDGFSLGEGEHLSYPGEIAYYGTGDYTWEDFKALEGDCWQDYDWTTNLSNAYGDYFRRDDYVLGPYDLTHSKDGNGSASGSGSTKGYDPETNTVTWMFHHDFNTGWDLTEQPLTILVTPPLIEAEDGTRIAVTDHPAIVTFRPAYDGPQALSGVFEEGDVKLTATLSTFSLSLEAEGMGYPYYEDMVKDTCLIDGDGKEHAVRLMGYTNGGGSFGPEGQPWEVSTSVHFILLTDISEFTALRMGDYTFPLN